MCWIILSHTIAAVLLDMFLICRSVFYSVAFVCVFFHIRCTVIFTNSGNDRTNALRVIEKALYDREHFKVVSIWNVFFAVALQFLARWTTGEVVVQTLLLLKHFRTIIAVIIDLLEKLQRNLKSLLSLQKYAAVYVMPEISLL